MATLRKPGDGIMKSKIGETYQMMSKVGVEHRSQSDKSVSSLYKGKCQSDGSFGTEIVIIAVVSAVAVWLLVGLILVCYRFLTKHSERCSPCESKTTPFMVLYENADYCEPDTCPSKPLRKSVIEKLKEWWRERFGRCPGECQDHADEELCLAAISYNNKDTVSNNSKIYSKKKYTKFFGAFEDVC